MTSTAKRLEEHPMLLRLGEREAVEQITSAGPLKIVLGKNSAAERGLTDRLADLL